MSETVGTSHDGISTLERYIICDIVLVSHFSYNLVITNSMKEDS